MQTNGKLNVCDGITIRQISELIKFSNTDPLILSTTRDKERFKDKKTYNDWLSKGRKIYTLIDTHKKLLGIIWFGIKNMPKNIHYYSSLDTGHYTITLAIRLYEHARGKGLSKIFINKAWDLYKETKEYLQNPNKGIWLETNINNFPAISAYKNLGFKLVSKPGADGKVLMIQS